MLRLLLQPLAFVIVYGTAVLGPIALAERPGEIWVAVGLMACWMLYFARLARRWRR